MQNEKNKKNRFYTNSNQNNEKQGRDFQKRDNKYQNGERKNWNKDKNFGGNNNNRFNISAKINNNNWTNSHLR